MSDTSKTTNRDLCGHPGNTRGYGYFNPDTGIEWSKDHPIESGQVVDATAVRPMRFSTFRREYLDGVQNV